MFGRLHYFALLAVVAVAAVVAIVAVVAVVAAKAKMNGKQQIDKEQPPTASSQISFMRHS